MNVITDIAAQGLTRTLSEQARTLSLADLPEDIRALARQCVLDYVACTLAGSREELTEIMLAETAEQGGAPTATVIGHAARLPVLSAALVNGSASHALDFDDVNLAMTGHPSVVLLSALLALAEERGASGAALLTAFVAGYELQCRLGMLLAPGHYNVLGFHATAHRSAVSAPRRLRAPDGAGRGTVRHRARHRGHAGSGPEIDVRHHVQAAARRQGGVSRTARRAAGEARLHQPCRRAGVPAGFRAHAQSRLQSRARAGDAGGRFLSAQQSVQVPRRLLPDARADRGRAQAARAARADARPHRAASGCGWTRPATASATFRRRAPAWRRSSACA